MAKDTISVSRKVWDKAQRLVDTGKVVRRPTHPDTYQVEGDTRSYDVWVSDAENVYGFCPCPAEKAPCSHLIAAVLYQRLYPALRVAPNPDLDPFRGIE